MVDVAGRNGSVLFHFYVSGTPILEVSRLNRCEPFNRSKPANPPWPCSEALFGLQQL
jgi:hypothetical protein